MIIFSMETDCVLVYGEIPGNRYFVGIVECSEISFEVQRLV